MATYPDLDQAYESSRVALNNIKTEVAADGTLRGQNNYSATVYNFSIVHPYITTAEKESIETFYNANSDISFTFNYAKDSADYTLLFLGEPNFNKVTASFWIVTTKAIGSLT